MYGPLKLIGVVLTLVWSCLAYSEYYTPPPTTSIQKTKMHQHIHMGDDGLRRNGQYSSEEIQMPAARPIPITSRSTNARIDDQISSLRIDDEISNRRIDDHISNPRIDDQISNLRINDQMSNRRIDDRVLSLRIDGQNSNRRINEHQYMRPGYRRGDIAYPDQAKKPNCVHGLCYGTEGYPKDKIQILLRNNEFAAGYFSSEPEESVTLDNRFNTEEETLCETTVQSIFPEKANNTQQIEKVIVNVEGHKQGIVFETCASPKIQCKFHETFPQGYDTSCKQKYVKKKLMVYSESEDEKFVFDTFEVPSCCVCVVKKMN